MNFEQALIKLLANEGGYSDNKNDPGGQTKYGITCAVARENAYFGMISELPIDVAKRIYKAKYWDVCKCDSLPDDVRFDVFDSAVNSGTMQAIKWLQRAVGVKDDGLIGPETIKACGDFSGSSIRANYNGQRLLFMTDLPTWPAFGRGWAKRIAKNMIGM